jgi:hypothetical protein
MRIFSLRRFFVITMNTTDATTNHSPLSDDQLSVVLQGPAHFSKKDFHATQLAIDSIRQYFPHAELILSTWKGAKLPTKVDVDCIVFNQDPGGQALSLSVNPKTGKAVQNNVNRQIVSSYAGVRVASRTHVLRVRSDMVFTSAKCLDWWGLATHRCAEQQCFKQRVIGYAGGTRKSTNPSGVLELPYHPGDWFFLGLKEDLLDLFDIPLCPDSDTNYLLDNYINPPAFAPWTTHRWYPEIYLWVSYLRKKGIPVNLDHSFDKRPENDLPSLQSLVNNFLLLDYEQLSFTNAKYLFPWIDAHEWGLTSMMTYQDWLDSYLQFCVPENEQFSDEIKTLVARSLPQQQWQTIALNTPNTPVATMPLNNTPTITIQGIVAPSASVVSASALK